VDPTPETSPSSDREHVRFIAVLTGVLVAAIWVRPMFSSLWLDETATWWVIDGSWAQTVQRAFDYQQSPLYYFVARLASMVSTSEFVLRIPSFLAFIGTAVLTRRMARRHFDAEVGRLSVLVLAGSIAAFSASDARPYALAIFLATLSATLLMAWLDGGRWWVALAYVLTSGLVVWAHYLFVLAVVAQVPYAILRIRRGTTRVSLIAVIGAWVGAAALVIPLAGQIASLAERRDILSIPSGATIADFFYAVVTPIVAVPLVAGVIVAALSARPSLEPTKGRGGIFALLIPWAVGPPWILYLVTVFTKIEFVQSRYLFSAAPALAILGGWAISCLRPASTRRIVAGLFAILAAASFVTRYRAGEDWRGALHVTAGVSDASTVILAHTEFIESAQIDWLTLPEERSYLLAPFSYYPVPGELIALPRTFDTPEATGYLTDVVDARLAGLDRFLLVTRSRLVPYAEWLDGRLGDDGWSWRQVGSFGKVAVVEFVRDDEATA
jgi:hypothetical protein